MVNSKDFAQDYNSYYRPSLDDDDATFFPKQGTLPIYYFKNGYYRPETQTQQLLEELENEYPDFDKQDQITANYTLYFLGFVIFILICLIRQCRKAENLCAVLGNILVDFQKWIRRG